MLKPSVYLLFALISVALACENDPNEVANLTRKKLEIEEGTNIKALFTQTANLKAELTSPLMYRVKADSPYTEFPKTLKVNFYGSERKLESVVKARYAKYFENQAKVYLRDSVVVYNTTGDTLYCDDLWWDQTAAIFYTDKPVVIRTITQKLNGTGLWALADFSKYTIKNTVGLVDVPETVQP